MEYQITQFNGGLGRDIRDKNTNRCAFSQNFNIYKNAHLITPQRTLAVQGLGSASGILRRTSQKTTVNSYLGLFDTTNVDGAAEDIRIYAKTSLTGDWVGGYTPGTRGFQDEMFFYYTPTNSVYFYDGTYLAKRVVGGALSDVGNLGASSFKTDAFENPNDGKLYFATDNKLHRVDSSGTLATDILAESLPSSLYITSIDVHGIYLTLACKPVNGQGSSVLYLVDTDLTDPAPIDVIDLGVGNVFAHGSISGVIFAVLEKADGDYIDNKSLVIRYWGEGDEASTFREISASNIQYARQSVVRDNKLFFACRLTSTDRDSSPLVGIWSIGKIGDTFALSLDTVDVNLAVDNEIELFDIIGDYRFMYTGNDDTRRSATGVGTYATGVYVTNKIHSERIGRKLALKNTAVRMNKLTTGQQVKVYYSVDNGSWVQITGETTVGSVTTTAEHDYLGDRFDEGYEYQFKFESVGGAEITGFYANFEENNE